MLLLLHLLHLLEGDAHEDEAKVVERQLGILPMECMKPSVDCRSSSAAARAPLRLVMEGKLDDS